MDFGKQFEDDFKNSFKEYEGSRILRLYDTTNGFKGVANICDFIYYCYPYIGYFELKSVQGKTLSFSIITDNQWKGLSRHSKLKGAVSAILIQFREYKEGYLVPIQVLEHILANGKKSINIDECRKWGMNLDLQYKRTRCYIEEQEFKINFLAYKIPQFEEE